MGSDLDGWNPHRAYSKTDHSAFDCPSCRHGSGLSCRRGSSCSRCHGSGRASQMLGAGRLRMRAGLFCVFSYLDTRTLLTAAQFLLTLSQWCSHTRCLVLQNLRPRARAHKETRDDYLKSTRGCLEVGLEAVLKVAGRSLQILAVTHCPNVLTDRSLWLVSCYCRTLHTLTYRSVSDPVGQEVIWALGAGCRDITCLQVTPMLPCQQPSRFSNRCLQMIGRCWPHLRKVGVGGAGCGIQGLASLVRNCLRLCVLELHHVRELGLEECVELCRDGLQDLHTLTLTHTPVTADALLHFTSVCAKLRCVEVQVGIADYFQNPDSDEAKKLFQEVVNDLQALRERPGLSEVLQVKVDRLC